MEEYTTSAKTELRDLREFYAMMVDYDMENRFTDEALHEKDIDEYAAMSVLAPALYHYYQANPQLLPSRQENA